MNKVCLVGRLARDAELRFTDGGKAVLYFTIAVDRDGNKADFPNCFMIGETAEKIADYMRKGKLVSVEGQIRTNTYEKDGQKRYSTDVFVDRVRLLGKKEDDK